MLESASSAPARSIEETARSISPLWITCSIGSRWTSTSYIERSIASGLSPWLIVRLPCGSRSTASTRLPCSRSATARFSVDVVFATPPFWFAKAMTCASAFCGTVSGSGSSSYCKGPLCGPFRARLPESCPGLRARFRPVSKRLPAALERIAAGRSRPARRAPTPRPRGAGARTSASSTPAAARRPPRAPRSARACARTARASSMLDGSRGRRAGLCRLRAGSPRPSLRAPATPK